MKVRLAGIEKESVVDGPGIRYVIFAQGCGHKCEGCHNPETHDFSKGYIEDADKLIMDILNRKYIDGVTFSGGDPFYQSEEFKYIAKKLKSKEIHIMAYTGFNYEELLRSVGSMELLKYIDIIVDGPFILKKKSLKTAFRGSSNQRIIDVKQSINKGKIISIDI